MLCFIPSAGPCCCSAGSHHAGRAVTRALHHTHDCNTKHHPPPGRSAAMEDPPAPSANPFGDAPAAEAAPEAAAEAAPAEAAPAEAAAAAPPAEPIDPELFSGPSVADSFAPAGTGTQGHTVDTGAPPRPLPFGSCSTAQLACCFCRGRNGVCPPVGHHCVITVSSRCQNGVKTVSKRCLLSQRGSYRRFEGQGQGQRVTG